jgi:general secretion pathway protein G
MRTRRRCYQAGTAGFTLVEIMVVVVIIGLLSTLVAMSVMNAADTAREEKAAADVQSIAGAVRLYYAQHGRVPVLADLTVPDAKGKVWLDTIPPDPWQNEYVVLPGDPARAFAVVSPGPNHVLGDADDVSSRDDAR